MAERDILRQRGIGSLSEWCERGLSRKQVYALAEAGRLVKLRYGAYATSDLMMEAEKDPQLRRAVDAAAVRVTRRRQGISSHHTAAQMHGLHLLNEPPHGTVTLTVSPGTRTGTSKAGVVCFSADLPRSHVTRLYGVPVTTAGRTVIDIARTSPFMEGVVLADSAIHQLKTSKAELLGVLALCERWPGSARAREVIDFADGLAESVFESCARVVFREHGLPPPRLQVPIYDGGGGFIARVDFYWPEYRVAAEADGLLKYDSGQRAIDERRRDRLLGEVGREVVHFTWKELFAEPGRVAARIRMAIDRQVRLGAAARDRPAG